MNPGELTRNRLNAADRRSSILDAALDLFGACGYEVVTVRDIATAAGVTKPVIYDHFDSKQELYVALLDREATRMSDALSARHQPDAPLDHRLRTLALDAVLFARKRLASAQLLLQAPVGDSEIRAAHERIRAATRSSFAAAILADPGFRPAAGFSRRANAELLGDLHSAVLMRLVSWAIENPRVPASALSKVFVDTLWTGLDI